MIKEWFKRIKDYPRLQQEVVALSDELGIVRSSLQDYIEENVGLINDIHRLKPDRDVSDASYWNNKWKQSKVYYNAPKRTVVTIFLNRTQELQGIKQLQEIYQMLAQEMNIGYEFPPDNVPLAVMQWVDSKFKKGVFKYVPEKGEQWQLAEETLASGKGDCDDYGILMYSLIRELFLAKGLWEQNKHRLKCVAGNVNKYSDIPSVEGGHFYLLWLHSDGQWRTVETTYFRERAILNWDVPHKLKPQYGVIWFTFNSDYSWSQNSVTVSKEDYKKG